MASIAVLAFRGCLYLAPRYAGVPEAGCHEGSYFAGCHACGSYTLRGERLYSFLTEPWYDVTQLLCTIN